MKLTEEMKAHILAEIERVDYGKVTICMSANNRTIDIVTEERRQFEKPKIQLKPRPGMVYTGERREG